LIGGKIVADFLLRFGFCGLVGAVCSLRQVPVREVLFFPLSLDFFSFSMSIVWLKYYRKLVDVIRGTKCSC
jgi:hypothetical protein